MYKSIFCIFYYSNNNSRETITKNVLKASIGKKLKSKIKTTQRINNNDTPGVSDESVVGDYGVCRADSDIVSTCVCVRLFYLSSVVSIDQLLLLPTPALRAGLLIATQ